MTQELIKVTTLLNRALVLLSTESMNKDKHIESLQKGPRVDLTPDFQIWLLEKTQAEYNDIANFICKCEQYIGVAECSEVDPKEQEAQKIVDYLNSNQAIKQKLISKMQEK